MSDIPTDADKVFEIKITSGAWHRPSAVDSNWHRLWSGPPYEGGPNVAARVAKKYVWPFTYYEWEVFAPIGDESVDNGSKRSLEAAKAAADEALDEFCKAAAGGPK